MLTRQADIHNSAVESPVWRSGALWTGRHYCKDGNGRAFVVGFGGVCLAKEQRVIVPDAHWLSSVVGEAIGFDLVHLHPDDVDSRLTPNSVNAIRKSRNVENIKK